MDPATLAQMLRGAERRYERECQRLAWTVANLMNATGNLKEPVTVEALLVELLGAEWVDRMMPGRHERARRTFDRSARHTMGYYG